ncbi:hypothetical protein QBC43DRAFT_334433 [Cladorrhinum sp. PSN259]|nr:hypothetical protein QBC43DRAFT_334433 [Cladorrhinum sp. PSN259]
MYFLHTGMPPQVYAKSHILSTKNQRAPLGTESTGKQDGEVMALVKNDMTAIVNWRKEHTTGAEQYSSSVDSLWEEKRTFPATRLGVRRPQVTHEETEKHKHRFKKRKHGGRRRPLLVQHGGCRKGELVMSAAIVIGEDLRTLLNSAERKGDVVYTASNRRRNNSQYRYHSVGNSEAGIQFMMDDWVEWNYVSHAGQGRRRASAGFWDGRSASAPGTKQEIRGITHNGP